MRFKALLSYISITFIILIWPTVFIYAQRVGIGTTSPQAKLDVYSTNRGLLLPRLHVSQRDSIVSPAHGLLIFNVDSFTLEMYDSVTGNWYVVADSVGCALPCSSTPGGSQPVIGVGIGVQQPHHSAMLEIRANKQGVLFPRLTATHVSAMPHVPYMWIVRRDTLRVDISDGSSWYVLLEPLRCASPCTSPPTGGVQDTSGVGIGVDVPHPSAVLEVQDTQLGILIPRLTVLQRQNVKSPAHGLLIFDVDSFCLEAYDSIRNRWVALSCPKCYVKNCLLTLTASQWRCVGDTVSFVVTGCQPTNRYEWTFPSSWTYISGQYTDTLKIRISTDTGMVKVRECAWCGCGPFLDTVIGPTGQPYNLTINQSPADSVCPVDTVTLLVGAQGGITDIHWVVAGGWVVVDSVWDTLRVVPPGPGVSAAFAGVVCNPCGCDTIWDTVLVKNAVVNPTIVGPTSVCKGEQAKWRIIPGGATSWTWSYPASWTLVTQGGDSLVVIPDTTDGYVIVTATDGCAMGTDSIYVIADTCYAFCMALGTSGPDEGYDILDDGSGNLIITGYLDIGNYPKKWIFKLAPDGSTILTNRVHYYNPYSNYATGIRKTNDGGFIVCGWGMDWPYGDGTMIKYDANLNIQWIKACGSSAQRYLEVVADVVQLPSGSYVLVGDVTINTDPDRAILLMTDANGTIKWGRLFSAGWWVRLYGVAYHNGYIYAKGLTSAVGLGGNYDAWVVKYDTLGNFIWAKRIGSSTDDDGVNGSAIEVLPDGSIVVGVTADGVNGGDAIVYRLDSNGNLIWATRVYVGSGYDFIMDLTLTSDGGIACAGGAGSAGAWDVWVFKLDTAGNLIWSTVVGGGGQDFANGITETTGGYLAVTGRTTSFGYGSSDVFVVKLRPDGTLPCTSGCNVSYIGNATSWSAITGYTPSISTYGSSWNLSLSTTSTGSLVKICP